MMKTLLLSVLFISVGYSLVTAQVLNEQPTSRNQDFEATFILAKEVNDIAGYSLGFKYNGYEAQTLRDNETYYFVKMDTSVSVTSYNEVWLLGMNVLNDSMNDSINVMKRKVYSQHCSYFVHQSNKTDRLMIRYKKQLGLPRGLGFHFIYEVYKMEIKYRRLSEGSITAPNLNFEEKGAYRTQKCVYYAITSINKIECVSVENQ